MRTTACCLRSTKDRPADIQRQRLHRFAQRRGLIIVEDLADVVGSGKGEDHPGFQRLIQVVVAAPRSLVAMSNLVRPANHR